MPVILTPEQIKKLNNKKKIKKMRPVKPSLKAERAFLRKTELLWRRVMAPGIERIKSLVAAKAEPYLIAQEIEALLSYARSEYGMAAVAIAGNWADEGDQFTRERTEQGLASSLSIDLSIVLDDPVVKNALALGNTEASQLIVTIPEQYWGNVARAVSDAYHGKDLPEGRTLLEQIQHIGRVSLNRARVIARDQTSKMTSTLNEVRQTSIGVEGYYWRTVQDQRVAGTPNGRYPDPPKNSDKHGNHYEREGKIFWWKHPTAEQKRRHPDWLLPPPDGAPGWPIQCRCSAEPFIELDRIVEFANKYPNS